MVFRRRFTAAVAFAGLAVLLVTLASCGRGSGEGGTPPPATPTIKSQTSRQIDFATFKSLVSPPGVVLPNPVNRLEIEIDPATLPGPAGLKALEVEIEEPEEIADEEEIKSRIVGITLGPSAAAPSAQATTITLELGNLKIDFSAATEFKDDRGNGSKPLNFTEFVAAVTAANPSLANPLPVEVERPPLRVAGAIVAQDPDVATFTAAEIKLVDEDDIDEPEIEINVDADNLVTGSAECPPDGLTQGIRVLGLCIDISQAQLEQEVEVQVPAIPGAVVEFEDRVVDVNVETPTTGTFTLASGTLVRVTTDTIIDQLGDLLSLQEVADKLAVLAADERVRAEGDAKVVAVGPPVVLEATNVKFEVDQLPPP